jgi:hypothetical protein
MKPGPTQADNDINCLVLFIIISRRSKVCQRVRFGLDITLLPKKHPKKEAPGTRYPELTYSRFQDGARLAASGSPTGL